MSYTRGGPSKDPRLEGITFTITMDEHHGILDKERERHEATVKRLSAEIERLKAALQLQKQTAQQFKRKAQEELRQHKKNGKQAKRKATAGPRSFFEQEASPSPTGEARRKYITGKHFEKWSLRYEELKAYKELNGHCEVQKHEHKELWVWCQSQRTEYNKLVKGQHSNMTPDRLSLLTALNFQWVRVKTQPLPWEERFEQLKAYKEKHGHVRIPQKVNDPPGLGNWVLQQRRHYREHRTGLVDPAQRKTHYPMTEEKIQLLESLGFEWSLRNRGGGGDQQEITPFV